jgi:hypothetical protein
MDYFHFTTVENKDIPLSVDLVHPSASLVVVHY